jgi:hypothetical protein
MRHFVKNMRISINMKTFFFFLSLFFSSICFSRAYYISSSGGRRQPHGPGGTKSGHTLAEPFKGQHFFANLQPGDSVLLKRGDTFSGSLSLTRSGLAGAPLVVGAYGSGARPVISGTAPLTNWVSVGGGIWECHEPSLGVEVNQVLVRWVPREMGRWPNSTAANKGYLDDCCRYHPIPLLPTTSCRPRPTGWAQKSLSESSAEARPQPHHRPQRHDPYLQQCTGDYAKLNLATLFKTTFGPSTSTESVL